ncbi:hypothetical protein ACGFZB_38295 [Streptomyces cinerochromogenes]|uniref:DUF3558 domain-containing protein n=1 Tax=Streptomyces cinerochromogenes TaxID=66422 RepID=A0ABW7BH86_9ACTN
MTVSDLRATALKWVFSNLRAWASVNSSAFRGVQGAGTMVWCERAGNRATAGLVLSVLLAVAVTSCSDGDDTGSSTPPAPSERATGGQPPEQSPSAGNGLPTEDDLGRMLPAAAELPTGWKLSGEQSVGWRDGAAVQRAAEPLHCGAMPQEAAERHGLGHMQFNTPGNEDQGDGVFLQVNVPTGADGFGVSSSSTEAVEMIEENLTLDRKLYKCFSPEAADVGDAALVFNTGLSTNIIMRVGPVEVTVYAPLDGRPTAQEWANVMEQRVRAVLDGKAPTARVALP